MGLPRQEYLLRWEEGICISVPSGFRSYLQIRKRCCFCGNQTHYGGAESCWNSMRLLGEKQNIQLSQQGNLSAHSDTKEQDANIPDWNTYMRKPRVWKISSLGFPGRFKRSNWVGWLENSPTLSWPSSEVVEPELACFLYFPKSWWKQIFSGTSELLFKFAFHVDLQKKYVHSWENDTF